MTFVVEPQSIDHRTVLWQPKNARLGIALLRLRRNGTGFYESESELEHRARGDRVFVEACGKPNRIGEVHTKKINRQPFDRLGQRGKQTCAQRREGERVGLLRVEREEGWANNAKDAHALRRGLAGAAAVPCPVRDNWDRRS